MHELDEHGWLEDVDGDAARAWVSDFGPRKPQLRMQIINLTNTQQWVAQASQTLVLFPPRTVRLVLTQSL